MRKSSCFVFNILLTHIKKLKTANGVTQEIVKSSQVATVVIDEQFAFVTLG